MIELVKDNQGPSVNRPKIVVVGVGGAGCNAVDTMADGSLEGVDFVAVNTDVQALSMCLTQRKIQIGKNTTNGLGTGSNPNLGEQAANEDRETLRAELEGADLVFITAGLGGGTGTGASTVIAEIVKEQNAISVGITTKPFDFEGPVRRAHAERGQSILRKKVDTFITVPNQRLIRVVDESTTLKDAFRVADGVLKQCVCSIADLITRPGLINLDFSDIKAIMDYEGGAVMGVGYGKGENRSTEAFQQASSSPLMEEMVIEGAKGILVHITGPDNLTLFEVNQAIEQFINAKAVPDAHIIFGTVIDETLDDEMKVTILASGFKEAEQRDVDSAASQDYVTTSADKDFLKPAYVGKPSDFLEPLEDELSLAPRAEQSRQSVASGVGPSILGNRPSKTSGKVLPTIFGSK